MTNDEFVAQFIAYKGGDEIAESNVLAEITELEKGRVEIAFSAPIPGNPRIYLSVPVGELMERIARWGDK